MPLSRFGWCLRFAVWAALMAVPVRAEPSASAKAEPARGAQAAAIVLVGAAGRDPELRALLSELLERRAVQVQLSTHDGFDQAELLRDAAPSAAVQVFVVPGSGGDVRLYFRAPDGERFLLRSLLLREGFDDVGREQIGQIVETATAALLHPGAGLTREQVELALTRETLDSDAAPPAAAPPAKAAKPEQTASKSGAGRRAEARRPTTLESWLALRYGAVASGGSLSVAHGPGLELGLALEHGLLWRARLSVERDFPQTLETAQVAAEIRSVHWQVAADAGLALTKQQRLLMSLGWGQDRSDVKPVAAMGSSVAPAPAFQNNTPVAHAELRYEAGSPSLRVAVALGADVSLVDTHYDVAHQNEHERVAGPWLVRPSGSLALAFCPRWATF